VERALLTVRANLNLNTLYILEGFPLWYIIQGVYKNFKGDELHSNVCQVALVACARWGWYWVASGVVECVTLLHQVRCFCFYIWFENSISYKDVCRPYQFLFDSAGNDELAQQHLMCRVQGKDAPDKNCYWMTISTTSAIWVGLWLS